MTDPTPHHDPDRSTPAQLRSKLGTYLIGVAIGFLLLGTFYYQKHQASKRLQAQTQQTSQDTPSSAEPTP